MYEPIMRVYHPEGPPPKYMCNVSDMIRKSKRSSRKSKAQLEKDVEKNCSIWNTEKTFLVRKY